MTILSFDSVEQARQQVLTAMRADDTEQTQALINHSLAVYPQDGPLLFLAASEMAEQQLYEQALIYFGRAVDCDPQLHIARFQLCLLAASLDQRPLINQHLPILMALDDNQYLSWFANGLAAIFADDLPRATTLIEQGMTLNTENPALNHDMQQMLIRIQDNDDNDSGSAAKAEQAQEDLIRSSSVLLDIYKNTH